jgi:hypothetical protein
MSIFFIHSVGWVQSYLKPLLSEMDCEKSKFLGESPQHNECRKICNLM